MSTPAAVEYIVAGRRLTLFAFTATLVTTWYGGILGVGEYTWQFGISNWLVFGIPYYLYAALFAVFLARRARQSGFLTVPDLLAEHFGRPAALAGAGMVFVMTAPAAYVLMLGVLVNFVTGWPIWVGVVAGTIVSVSYVVRGGLRAVVLTDMVQFGLMFLGFLVLVPVCVVRYGGWAFLQAGLPESHLQWDGGLGWQSIAVWYVIAMSTIVEPAFYQRCYAAKSGTTARRGIFLAIGFWILFDFLTTAAGLYARVLLPDLADPVQAFPALAAYVLPVFWQGVFTLGLLATIMSTIDSYALICSVTLGRDLIGRWRAPVDGPISEKQSMVMVRWSVLATAVMAVTLALLSGSVIRLWKMMGSVGTPVLLGPMVLAHCKCRVPGRAVVWSMGLSGAVVIAWLGLGQGGAWLGVEAIFPGLVVSVLVLWGAWGRTRSGSV